MVLMIMNKRGSIGSILLIALIALGYFMFGMIIYQFFKPVIDVTRTDLSCTTPATSGDKIVCLIVDAVVPLAILTILSVTGGIITEKMIK